MLKILVKALTQAACFLAKFGVGKRLCSEYKAATVSGAAQRAFQQKKYDQCYLLISPYIEQKDDYRFGSIKYIAGLLFFYGHGVSQNRQIANQLFEDAASLGNEEAQVYLSQYNGPYKTKT